MRCAKTWAIASLQFARRYNIISVVFELWGNSHRRNVFALLYTETPLRPTVIPSDLQPPRDLWIIPVSTLTHTNGRQPRLLKSLKTHNTGVIILSPVPPATRLASRPWWRHQMETFSALLAALCEGDAGDLRRHRAHYGITLTWIQGFYYRFRTTGPYMSSDASRFSLTITS